MNIDENGTSYAEMQAVPFSHADSRVPGDHGLVGDNYGQIPVIMSDGEGKEFMVHFADDRDMEHIEDDLELGVGNESLKMTYQHENQCRGTPETRAGHPIPDQERFLPIANVARVMKTMIPSSGKIAKDAKECVQECVSEFISFITSEANDKCMSEKRKTISADDLLEAINNMGFDNYVAPLQLFLERYRAAHKLGSGHSRSHTPTTRSFSAGPERSPTQIICGTTVTMPSCSDYSAKPPPLMTTVQTMPTQTSSAHTYQSTSSLNGAAVMLAGGGGGMAVTALQQQPMQIYIDPASKQHYMAIETEEGMQLYPIQIRTDGPVAYSFAPETTTMPSSSNGNQVQTFIMMAAGDDEEQSKAHAPICAPTMSSSSQRTNRTQASTSSAVSSTARSGSRQQSHNELNSRTHSRNSNTATYAAAPAAQSEVVSA
ncbi:unnamed protein product [Heligmosomoides polygyrus]|uniref:Nuclear transcription factor Y subunit beta n=1 Tax=Heligmosomoides polygyrus TaxID=6339 RepID=A0A3P7TEX6_HELPZ|nr:unnamed protein product [Heligmosomoides polygyrus]